MYVSHVHTCMHLCRYMHACFYMYVYLHINPHAHSCMCMYAYVYMSDVYLYACIYVCTRMYDFTCMCLINMHICMYVSVLCICNSLQSSQMIVFVHECTGLLHMRTQTHTTTLIHIHTLYTHAQHQLIMLKCSSSSFVVFLV